MHSLILWFSVHKKPKVLKANQQLQKEVTKEIRKKIENEARGMADKFGETTKIDKKKK